MVFTADDNLRLERLINAVASGNADSLDGIYLLAGKRMFAAATYLAGRTAAEDIVHDALIKIARFAGKYRQGTNAYGWVMQITKNTALDYLKRNKSRSEVPIDGFFSLASSDYSPEKRDTAIALESALKKLETSERNAIYCKYFLDMTVREIADNLNMSKSAAQRLIERAENNLKNLLKAGRNDF